MTPPYKLNTYAYPLLLLGSGFGALLVLSLSLILIIEGTQLGNFLIVTGGATLISLLFLLIVLNRRPIRLNYLDYLAINGVMDV